MNNQSKEIFLLSEIAACISLDKYDLAAKKVRVYNKNEYKPEKLYELILQSYLFCGFPAMIETLKLYKKTYKEKIETKSGYDIFKFRVLGIRNCKLIYKNNYKKLIENMKRLSPDLKEWMIIEGYGKVMGRNELSIKEREIINISFLSSRYFEDQLHSHLKGCLFTGTSKKELNDILNNLIGISGKSNIKMAIKLLNNITK